MGKCGLLEMPSAVSQTSASWSRYWQGGYKDTCFLGADAFSLTSFWQDFFRSLANDARVLDLATGNGAVALIAAGLSQSEKFNFSITGVDFAVSSPEQIADLDRSLIRQITFLPQTPLEDMPFSDASFDAATSQFGFEYSDAGKSVAETARVIVPGGQLKMLMHAADSEVRKASRNRLRRARELLARGQLLDLCQQLAKTMLSASATQDRIRRLEARFASRYKSMQQKLRRVPADDASLHTMRYLARMMQGRASIPATEFATTIKELALELRAYTIRLSSMIQAARSEQDLVNLQHQFEVQGFTDISFAPVQGDKGLVGWSFSASRV